MTRTAGSMSMLDGPPKLHLSIVTQGPERSATHTDIPGTSTQSGAINVDALDELLVELEVDPLDALIAELDRIEGHETMLQDAVANNKAVVVHPRPEAMAAPRAPETPATPQSFVVEGGLASFEIAQDLLYLDFSRPEHAPQEFRRLSFNPERTISLRSGISGSFGQLDPASLALHDYLRRIQHQAQQVRILIDGQRQMRPGGKVLAPGGSSADLHSDQIRAGQVSSYSTAASNEPPAMPRTSEGAVSIEAKLQKPSDGQSAPGHRTGRSHGDQEVVAAVPHVTITTHPETSGKGEAQQKHTQNEQKITRPHFYGRPEPKRLAAGHEAKRTDTWAVLRLGLFIASFGFYLFTRSTTVDAMSSVPLFLYQLAVLLAEGLHFFSGCLVGMWQTRNMENSKHLSQQRGQARGTDGDGRNELLPVLEGTSARQPFSVQVILNGVGKPLKRLLMTVGAVRAMEVPEGCSASIHIIHDARQRRQAQWSQSSLDGLILHDVSVLHDEPDHPAGESRAWYTNMVLRQLHPEGEDIPPTDIVALFQAGQVGATAFLQQALPELERPGVRMVYSQAITSTDSCYSDIYNQGERYCLAVTAPHTPAWHCTAVLGNPAYLVYASSLHNMGWLQGRPGAEASKIMQCLAREDRLAVPHQSRIEECAPSTVPETYQAAFEDAQGLLQWLLFPHKLTARLDSSLRPLLHQALAWCTCVSAVSTLFFTVIPVIRIIYGVFPFNPNRWFGIGFLAYYCCCSPLLYQVWTLQRAVMFWNWHVSSRMLWWEHLRALSKMLPISRFYSYLHQRHKQPERDAEEGASGGQKVEVRRRQIWPHRRRICRQPRLDVPLARDVPWRAVWACVLSVFGACVGTWLLFQDFQTAYGPRRPITVLALFAANLSLILSILWCLCNALVYALPCCYAVKIWRLRKREDGQASQGRQQVLALLSMVALLTTMCCMLLAAVACIGLGEGAYRLQGTPENQDYDFPDALRASMQFFSAQRSGALGPDYPVTWRGDSGLDDNPVGGYYLGTNNLKVTFPIAAATFHMAWGIASLPGRSAGRDQQDLTEIRWAADYLLACFDGSSLVTQVGDTAQELSLWERPEDMSHRRPSFSVGPGAPGADVMAHTAAALAAASVVFAGQDAAYAGQLLGAAQSLYLVAAAHEGLSSTSLPHATLYSSTSYLDDLMLASAWLAEVSGRPAYALEAEAYWNRIFSGSDKSWQSIIPDWNNQWWAGNVILAGLTGNHSYQNQVEAFITAWTQGGSGVAYTPQGLAVAGTQGVLRNAANAALLALVHARHSSGYGAVRLACWARDQIRYILGAGGRSFVVGWGVDPPTHVPSPGASCPSAVVPCAALKASSPQYASPDSNPHTITGALVSGPSPEDTFNDVRSDADTAISVEYNGGFSGALTMLAAKEWMLTCGSRPGLIDRAGGHLYHSVW